MLFNVPLIPGLVTRGDFVSGDEEAALIDHIAALDLTPFRFQGFLGKRLTTSFGLSYDFARGRLDPADPMPDWLHPLRRRAAAFAGLDEAAFEQALVIRYDPGAGIGWHRDRPQFDQIVGVSLGAPATMRFRQRIPTGFRRVNLPLEPRSAYRLAGEVRSAWEHGIAGHDALRFSITFRSMRGPT